MIAPPTTMSQGKLLVSMRLSKLVLDNSLYPRQKVDPEHVAQLLEAYRAGAKIPPIIVDADRNIVIDGRHRLLALREHLGTDGEIKVEVRRYANIRQMFLESIDSTSKHGLRFNQSDVDHLVRRAVELRIDPELLASALSMTKEKVSEMMLAPAPRPSNGMQPTGIAARLAREASAARFGGRPMERRTLRPLPATITQPSDPQASRLADIDILVRTLKSRLFASGHIELQPLEAELRNLQEVIENMLVAMDQTAEIQKEGVMG